MNKVFNPAAATMPHSAATVKNRHFLFKLLLIAVTKNNAFSCSVFISVFLPLLKSDLCKGSTAIQYLPLNVVSKTNEILQFMGLKQRGQQKPLKLTLSGVALGVRK